MTVYLEDADFTLHHGDVLDVLRELPADSVDCCVTSPPYWGLRDYGVAGQIGLEASPQEYVAAIVAVFEEVRRVLAPHGTLWLNLGDSYAANRSYQVHNTKGAGEHTYGRGSEVPEGLKPKDLVGVPWRVAFALQDAGWYLRSDIIWSKPNPMPESVTDRPTKAHEYVFLLSKQPRYYFDQETVREPYHWPETRPRWPGIGKANHEARAELAAHGHDESEPMDKGLAGRNIRTVWEIATQPYAEAHFATYPQELVLRCILAGCPVGGVVLDPFLGSGTTALVARQHDRRAIGIELNAEYCALAARRNAQQTIFAEPAA